MHKKLLSKNVIILLTVAAVLLVAQAIIITLTVGNSTVTINKLPNSTVTFSIPNTGAGSNGTFTANVNLTTTRRPPAAVNFDILYNPSDITGLTVSVGPTATSAGKQITCNDISSNDKRCIIAGLNTNVIGPGIAAVITGVANKNTTLTLTTPVASSADGTQLTSTVSPGGQITVAVVVVSLTCTPPSYELPGLPPNQYNIESGETLPCTVTLNQPAPSGGFVAPISSTPPGITAPASVTVIQGATSASFNVVGQ